MLWIPPKRTLAEQFPRGNFASLADLLSRGLNSLVNRIVWKKFPCCGRQSNPSDAGGAASQARDSCRLDRNQLTRGQPIEVSRTGCILLIRYCGFCASSRGHSYGGAPSAQGSRALDRGRDAISAVPAIDCGKFGWEQDSPVKKTPRGECPIAALSPSRVTDEANFGWRCWRRGCPRTRGGSGAGGVAQIAAGIDAFTRHTVCSVSKTR